MSEHGLNALIAILMAWIGYTSYLGYQRVRLASSVELLKKFPADPALKEAKQFLIKDCGSVEQARRAGQTALVYSPLGVGLLVWLMVRLFV